MQNRITSYNVCYTKLLRNVYGGMESEKGVSKAVITKGAPGTACKVADANDGKNIIVFSGDLSYNFV